MASTLHQGLLFLFRDDPWLAFDILGIPRTCEGHPVDRRAEIERDGRAPWTVRQNYPDIVLVHRDEDNPKRGVVITVEAQKKLDPDKRWLIPVYQSQIKRSALDLGLLVFKGAFAKPPRCGGGAPSAHPKRSPHGSY